MIVLHVLYFLITVSVIATMSGHQPKIDPLPIGLPPANLTASPTILRAARSADWRPMTFEVIYNTSINSLSESDQQKLKNIVNKVVTYYNKLLSVKATPHIIVKNPCGVQISQTKFNTDFVLVVQLRNESQCINGIQAGAIGCTLHGDKGAYRLSSGIMLICGNEFKKPRFDHAGVWYNVIRHEAAHALVFHDGLFEYFRNSDNEYHTGKNPRPIYQKYGIEKDGELLNVVKKVTRQWKLPSGTRPHTVWMLTTPAVVREVRDHFDCSDLEGAELESQLGPGTAYKHLETRLFESDVMTGATFKPMVMSRITLAVFEDSGWYKVNYDMAESLEWGKGKGCDFAKNSCYEWMDTHEKDPFPFCNRYLHKVCSSSREEVLTCDITNRFPTKPEFQYFESRPFMGYLVGLGDFCPYYSVSSGALMGENEGSLCLNPRGYGQTGTYQSFGRKSRCFSVESSIPHYPTAGCFETKCDTEEETYTVQPKGSDAVECPAGETVTIKRRSHSFTLKCPSYEEICLGKRTKPNTSTLSAKNTIIYFQLFVVLSMF